MSPEANGEPGAEVQAAGGVVLRRGQAPSSDAEVLVVHRPRHGDWSLPKGKLRPGEGWEEAAVREVREETAVRCRPLRELDPHRYRDAQGRPKRVRYWLMEPVGGDPSSREPDAEVDRVRWIEIGEALELLSYPHDRELVAEAVSDRAG